MNAPLRHATFAQFLSALVASKRSGVYDERLVPSAAATGMAEGVSSVGGFLVPDNVAADIWMRVYGTGSLIARCDSQPVTRGNGIKIPMIAESSRGVGSRFGGARMFWTAEGDLITPSKPRIDVVGMELKKLLGVVYATDELLEDAPALAAYLRRVFSLEAVFMIEDAMINGTGAGMPVGVLNSGALITIDKEAGQAAGTVAYANLTNMVSRLWGPSHKNAVWLMSNETLKVLFDLTTDEGVEVVTSDADGRYCLGIPIEVCEYTPALSSAGDILLCDFSQYLLIDRETAVDQSIHVQFNTDETAFRIRFRADGQPVWRAPITPRNSALTQSPFIALGAR